jgi:hypothetical protein
MGLLAGNAALLLFLSQSAVPELLTGHLAESARTISWTFEVFRLYAMFSVPGGIVVGFPFVLAFPIRAMARLPWIVFLLIGMTLGPTALLLIFVLLAHGRVSHSTFAHTGGLWLLSILVSAVSFAVYTGLVRNHIRST